MTAAAQRLAAPDDRTALRPMRAAGFRRALLLGAAVMTLALGATAAYLTWEGYRQSLHAARQQATAMAESTMGVLDKRFQVATVTLASLADDPRLVDAAARDQAWAAIRNRARAIEDRDAFGPAWLVMPDGSHHALGAWDDPLPRTDPTLWQRQPELERLIGSATRADRGAASTAVAAGVTVGNWQTPASPPTSGDHWFIPMAVATADASGRPRGALTMAVRLRDIRVSWERLSPPEGSTLWLRDARQPGRMLMSRARHGVVQPWVAYEGVTTSAPP